MLKVIFILHFVFSFCILLFHSVFCFFILHFIFSSCILFFHSVFCFFILYFIFSFCILFFHSVFCFFILYFVFSFCIWFFHSVFCFGDWGYKSSLKSQETRHQSIEQYLKNLLIHESVSAHGMNCLLLFNPCGFHIRSV